MCRGLYVWRLTNIIKPNKECNVGPISSNVKISDSICLHRGESDYGYTNLAYLFLLVTFDINVRVHFKMTEI
jgi:hypothetical protein